MRLIIGLGNPGLKYQSTRHNIGFLVIDKLASDYNISMSMKGFDACFGKGKVGEIPVLLAKPQTYMNLSGVSVKKLVDFFKIDFSDIIIVHDDIDLPYETIRLKTSGGHAGHKGLISIIEYLGNDNFIRVRLGIGRPHNRAMVEDYVLQSLTKDEMQFLPSIITTAIGAVTTIIISGIQTAMNLFNNRTTHQLNKGDDSSSL